MNRKTKALAAAAAVIFAVSVIWCAVILLRPKGRRAKIIQDGKVLYTLDLSREKDRLIEVEYQGRRNIIEIKDGRIRVREADCPDHICMDMGWLEDTPIVCLPNRLVIEFADGNGETDVEAR